MGRIVVPVSGGTCKSCSPNFPVQCWESPAIGCDIKSRPHLLRWVEARDSNIEEQGNCLHRPIFVTESILQKRLSRHCLNTAGESLLWTNWHHFVIAMVTILLKYALVVGYLGRSSLGCERFWARTSLSFIWSSASVWLCKMRSVENSDLFLSTDSCLVYHFRN